MRPHHSASYTYAGAYAYSYSNPYIRLDANAWPHTSYHYAFSNSDKCAHSRNCSPQ